MSIYNENRHKGIRVEFYMPDGEHRKMLATMTSMKIDNKSDFVRSAIKSYCAYQKAMMEESK